MDITRGLIIYFALSAIFYLPRPIYLRIKYFSKVENPKKEAIINSIVIGVLLLVSRTIHIFTILFFSFVYYFIGYAIIAYKEENVALNETKTEKNIKIDKEHQNFNKTFCTFCGKEIKENWTFCGFCGNKLK